MREILFYILIIICAFTDSFAFNQNHEISERDKYFENEARHDIQHVLNKRTRDDDYEDDSAPSMLSRNSQVHDSAAIDHLDQLLGRLEVKRRGRANIDNKQDNLRYGNNLMFERYDLSATGRHNSLMNNLDINHRNVIKRRPINVVGGVNRLNPFRERFSHRGFERNRLNLDHMAKYYDDENMLRNRVNHVNLKPHVYPAVMVRDDNYGAKKEEQHRHHGLDSKKPREMAMRTGNILMPDNDPRTHMLHNVFDQYRARVIPLRRNFGNDDDIEEKVNAKSRNNKKVLNNDNQSENNVNIDRSAEENDYNNRANQKTPITVLRTDVSEKINAEIEKKLQEYFREVEKMYSRSRVDDDENNLRLDSEKSEELFHIESEEDTKASPSSHEGKQGRGSRQKRASYTQAGYTQDPDTCKTYNENLVRLWANLSKYIKINTTEQPNERALHNIAMMIQAYLEHQNKRQHSESYKGIEVEMEEARDKVSDVLIKIKKMLLEDDGSPEKIMNLITKYIQPFYEDEDNKDCQEVNEESLSSAVELLYKNYLENSECKYDGANTVRHKRNRRKETSKDINSLSNSWHSKNNEDITSIPAEDELYEDFHRGKIERRRQHFENRRGLKSSKKSKHHSLHRSGKQSAYNNGKKPKVRSQVSQKSANRKQNKGSLKINVAKSRCESYAIRKLIVSLRPVIERFKALLECQLDNTLRSARFSSMSTNPYQLYASQYYIDGDSLRQNKVMSRKHTGLNRHSRKKQDKYDVYDKDDDDTFVPDDDDSSSWVRKYSHDEIADTNSDDYDGIHKARNVRNGSAKSQASNKHFKYDEDKNDKTKISDSLKETNVRYSDYDTFSEEDLSDDASYIFNGSDQQMNDNNTTLPFEELINLNNIKNTEQLPDEKRNKISFDGITEFLKRARESSLQTPEYVVPFALETNKGYVELTHLVKYPKILVYRPQFIVKNTMPYDDFLKTICNLNMTNDDIRLMKIVRHLPDNSVKVLFESEDFDAPLEIRNIDDNRRSYSTVYLTSDLFESGTDTMTDERNEGSVPSVEAQSNNVDESVNIDKTKTPDGGDDRNLSFDWNSNSTMNFASNSSLNTTDTDIALNSSSDTNSNKLNQSISKAQTGVDLRWHMISPPNSHSIPNLDLSSHYESSHSHSDSLSNSNSGSNSLRPTNSNQNRKQETFLATKTILTRWWKRWKEQFKGKLKAIIGKVASLSNTIDHLVKI